MAIKGKKIIIAGGSGLLGSALTEHFLSNDNYVIILSRSDPFKEQMIESVYWDGSTFDKWINSLNGADFLINLTGKNLNCRWTKTNRDEIIESRTSSVIALGEALKKIQDPPKKWIQVSAVGYYGDTGSDASVEESPPGKGFVAEVCRKWEDAFNKYSFDKIDTKIVRIGNVLTRKGGMLEPLTLLTKFFLGGRTGSGNQFISWIHIDDLISIFEFLIENENSKKVFNAVSPEPVTNNDFMTALRKVYSRPWSPPAPAFGVKLVSKIIGVPGDLILDSSKVLPKNLLEENFNFHFTDLQTALNNLKT